MNRTEAVHLCRFVKSLAPATTMDEFTPDAWAMVLDDVRYEDAQTAVRTIYREHTDDSYGGRKIEADDILHEVKRIRNKRIADHGEVIPPYFDTVAEDIAWRRDALRRIGNGETIGNTRGQLIARPTIGTLTKGMDA